MDVYSSLLNLNFMTSLRTGNLVVDMLIAVLIPFISGMINHFFRTTWPGVVRRLLTFFTRTSSTTFIQPPVLDPHGNALIDVNENGVLNEAITQYVSRKVKPTYERGAYRYKRPPGTSSADAGATLADVLEQSYCVQTVPADDCRVTIVPALRYSVVASAAAGGEDGAAGHAGDGGGGGGDDRGGGGRGAKKRTKAISLVTTQTGVMAKDVAADFVMDAWQWYKESLNNEASHSRYLLQPLLEKPSTDGLLQCQFFPLSQEKTFNTLFFPEKKKLMTLLDQFQSQTGKFAVPGFPHKLVLLLYGPPGTGKTSLVKAIAAYLERNLFSIPLSRVQTNRQLLQYMFDTRCQLPGTRRARYSSDQTMKLTAKKVVYVLEDIDAAGGVVRRDTWKDVALETDAAEEPSLKVPREDEDDANKQTEAEKEQEEEPEEVMEDEKEKRVTIQTPDDADENDDEDEQDDEESDSASSSTTDERAKVSATAASSGKTRTTVTINDSTKTDKLSIQGVLVALNGILNAPGRIVIMTTNHIDHLDEAITRPGVVTMKLHMSHFSPECAVEMVQHYFSRTTETGAVPQEQLSQVYEAVAQREGRAFSPAEVEQLCAENDTVEDLILALRKGSERDVF